jgi:ethanolamine utilization protein EutQ (cupin superfamily)
MLTKKEIREKVLEKLSKNFDKKNKEKKVLEKVLKNKKFLKAKNI